MTSSPPRTVSWKLRFRWLRQRPLALAVGLMGVGLVPLVVVMQYWVFSQVAPQLLRHVNYEAILREGENASGEVTQVHQDPAETVCEEHPWIVEYRFEADGREHRDWMKTLDGDVVSDWAKGQPVSVKYLAAKSMITDVRPHQFNLYLIWLVCACGWVVVGLLFLLYAFAGMRKKTRLYRDGLLAPGSLIAMHLANWLGFLPLFRFRFRVTYRFPDAQGKEVLGSSISTNVALLNGGKQGDPVHVLFLEPRPEINCLAEEQDLPALSPGK
jgi:hypothetical protein